MNTEDLSPVVCFTVKHSALDLIKPSALIRYATSLGWDFDENHGKYAGAYRNFDDACNAEPWIVIPHKTSLGDYKTRVLDLVREFARAMNAEPWVVAHELYKISVDERG